MSSITIVKPGLYTTIQDKGRYGYRKYGIPLAGSLDKSSAALANIFLNKDRDSPLIEVLLNGPEIYFNSDSSVVITGADISPSVDGQNIRINTIRVIKKGQVLSFGKVNYGAAAYIGFHQNLKTDQVLGSSSYSPGITSFSRCYAGQNIELEDIEFINNSSSSVVKPQKKHFFARIISVTKGPEYDLLDSNNKNLLFQHFFTVSREFSRIGFKLNGPQLVLKNSSSMISSAVMPGTVQLTPGGQLIVLMNDCQTTGGYPRVLQLFQHSINQLAQKKAGDEIIFKLLD